MAIQFMCAACGQPIEVDDEMANQAVTCPYCRKVVTAPLVSEHQTLHDPAAARPTAAASGPAHHPPVPVAAGTNILSWLSLACISGSLICFAVFVGFVLSIAKDHDIQQMPQAEFNKILQEEMIARTGVQFAGALGFCVFPPLGIVFAIVALVKRTPPKWPAITSLSISGLIILLMCFWIMLQAAQLPAQGAAVP
ncbi:MAG: hypothetical protein HS101_16685 [Planctomycetia bacterium]|jgi:hypothetical protein|nr:hypothetical protein [Planctomycetia bacterium]MCC7313997.1 hypothetical protein [Planctomycetota bacterium]OQZ05437.1 MAG: hypothetical protein B6D36_10095 [Planctomycetes bacterium UTPLA1]